MDKTYYAEKALYIGATGIICAFCFFAPTLFTFKSSLIKQSGTVENLKTDYIQVESSRGSKSIKSELKFTLNSTQSIYVLMKNIEQSRFNERFEDLEKQLRNSERATVWIKESQKEEYKPTVFQIADSSGKIIYDFEEAKNHSRFGFLVSFALGIFTIGIWLRHKYWKKPAHNNP
ncbi:hypothetical protein SCB49_03249 [unidentified eubacterium SCB49]|nr:hypothetical protein SCB49_03249 [unidentified eubacterium SCB49]